MATPDAMFITPWWGVWAWEESQVRIQFGDTWNIEQAVYPAVEGVCDVSLTQNTGRQWSLESDQRQPLVLLGQGSQGTGGTAARLLWPRLPDRRGRALPRRRKHGSVRQMGRTVGQRQRYRRRSAGIPGAEHHATIGSARPAQLAMPVWLEARITRIEASRRRGLQSSFNPTCHLADIHRQDSPTDGIDDVPG